MKGAYWVVIDLDNLKEYKYEWYKQFGGKCNVCHVRPIYALTTCGRKECNEKL